MGKQEKKEESNEKPFEFPVPLLDQINEHSLGGFLLHAVNMEGEVKTFCHFDNSLMESHVLRSAERWHELARHIELHSSIQYVDEDDDDEIPPEKVDA